MDEDESAEGARPQTKAEAINRVTGDAFGAGIALVVAPCMALYFGVDRFAAYTTVGLPILAIFGIMILFGALALVATLFQRLDLANPNQALALPEGSIRAAIALSLIVLFAIISIMLYRSIAEPYKVAGLTLTERTALLDKAAERVMTSVEEPCATVPSTAALAASATAASAPLPAKPLCAPEDQRFTLHLRPPPAQESTDLAKQLLILVGTLMTSVTSFYFASRGANPSQPTPSPQTPNKTGGAGTADAAATGPHAAAAAGADPLAAAAAAAGTGDGESHADGCNVDITEATPDEALPAARGGVAS